MTENLNNAEEIIARFGGIRPMAKAMDVAVTTVQGWKKRGSIPATRRGEIEATANARGIDLSDLLEGKSGSSGNAGGFQAEIVQATRTETPDVKARHEKALADAVATERRAARAAAAKSTTKNDDILRQIKEAEKKAVQRSLWVSGALVAAVCVIGGVLLWPSKQQIDQQNRQIEALQTEIEAMQNKQGVLKKLMPAEMQSKMEALKAQADTIQSTVNDLSHKAEAVARIAQDMTAAEGGSLSERLARLEQQVEALDVPEGLSDMITRLEGLSRSLEGQGQLSDSFAELQDIVMTMQGKVDNMDDTLNDALEAKQDEPDSALGETLDGVSGTDLKAAAILLGFSQLRSSLNRSQPFADDLVVLERLLGDKDPELNAALEALAPKAAEGVLTPAGLSDEFKGLAGDIVFSSLKGEELSMKDRAMGRLHDVLQVEKDGQDLIGTNTQITVAEAQKRLDQGDVQGAVALLQTLDGAAAETAQPFIDEAQMTLLAQSVEGLLGDQIMNRLSGTLSGLSAVPAVEKLTVPAVPADGTQLTMPDGTQMREVVDGVIEIMPQHITGGTGRVVSDEESGFAIIETKPVTP